MSYVRVPALGMLVDDDSGITRAGGDNLYAYPSTPAPVETLYVDDGSSTPAPSAPVSISPEPPRLTPSGSGSDLPHTDPVAFAPAPSPAPSLPAPSEPTPPRIWIDAPTTTGDGSSSSSSSSSSGSSSSGSSSSGAGDSSGSGAPTRWLSPRDRANDTGTAYDPAYGTETIIAPPGAPTIAETDAADQKTLMAIAAGVGLLLLLARD